MNIQGLPRAWRFSALENTHLYDVCLFRETTNFSFFASRNNWRFLVRLFVGNLRTRRAGRKKTRAFLTESQTEGTEKMLLVFFFFGRSKKYRVMNANDKILRREKL